MTVVTEKVNENRHINKVIKYNVDRSVSRLLNLFRLQSIATFVLVPFFAVVRNTRRILPFSTEES